MKRRVITILVVGMSLFSLAICVFWLRSHWRYDRISYRFPSTRTHFGSSRTLGYEFALWRGRLIVGRIIVPAGTPGYEDLGFSARTYPRDSQHSDAQPYTWAVPGMQFWHAEFTHGEFKYVFASCWLLATMTSAFALGVVIARSRIRSDERSGLCHTCGYDLRATPHRCPECGTVAVPRETSP